MLSKSDIFIDARSIPHSGQLAQTLENPEGNDPGSRIAAANSRYSAHEARRALRRGVYVGSWNAVSTHGPQGREYTPEDTISPPATASTAANACASPTVRLRRDGPMPEHGRERGPGKWPLVSADQIAAIYAPRPEWTPGQFAAGIPALTGVRYGTHHCWLLLKELRSQKGGCA